MSRTPEMLTPHEARARFRDGLRPAHGMPGFRQVLAAVADAWTTRREDLESAGSRIVDARSPAVPRMPGEETKSSPTSSTGTLITRTFATSTANSAPFTALKKTRMRMSSPCRNWIKRLKRR